MSRDPESARTSAFDYALPPDRIAQYPSDRRDESRLLVLDRASGALRHLRFRDLAGLMDPGDALVVNETRVFPARLVGRKPTGGRAEVLLLRRTGGTAEAEIWAALVRPGSKLRAGARVIIADGFEIEILERAAAGVRTVCLRAVDGSAAAIARHGSVPLPPYIGRPATGQDADRYQTVYARESGSVAAPTAGLHFTPDLLAAIEACGIRIVRLVLHVGPGTFRPVEVEDPALHRMHEEPFVVSEDAAAAIGAARAGGGRIWAVGTTVVRVLETLAAPDGTVRAGRGATALFIRPPYRFRVVDRLITNFHLPRSTLLMLVAAFAGLDQVLLAYREAIRMQYRFYSYGDAMAIL